MSLDSVAHILVASVVSLKDASSALFAKFRLAQSLEGSGKVGILGDVGNDHCKHVQGDSF